MLTMNRVDEPELSPNYPAAVGFIGLGNMGWWMARNLRNALPRGQSILYIFDVVSSILGEFQKKFSGEYQDIVCCSSSHEVGSRSAITFVIVPEGSHVRSVFLDPSTGLLSGGAGGALTSAEVEDRSRNEDLAIKEKTFVDCSTIDPATSLAVAKAVAASGAKFYDAPVSGGTPGAEGGTLTFMVGAPPQEDGVSTSQGASHFSTAVEPLLKIMGSNVICVGGPSLGLVAKLSNNYLSGIIAIATSEAMNIGIRHGIDPKVLSECFKRSSGQNWVNDTVNPVPGVCPSAVTSRGYKGGFKVQLMAKDVGLAVDAAESIGAKVVLGHAALETYRSASADPRCRDLDSRVVYRWLGGIEHSQSDK